MKDNNGLMWVIGGALLIGGALYFANKQSTVTIPPGYAYQGLHNNTSGNLYVDAAGQVFNALNQLVGTITGLINSQNQSSNNTNQPDSSIGYSGGGGLL